MLHRIRHSLKEGNFERQLENVVEADETFVGGKNKNRHADKKVKNSQGRSFKDKTLVLGLLERGKVLNTNNWFMKKKVSKKPKEKSKEIPINFREALKKIAPKKKNHGQ